VISRSEIGYQGQLVNDTLLPEVDNQEIVTIGGSDKEYWVFGTNYINDFPNTNEQGSWRVEVSPKRAAEQDYFLNVMHVKDMNGPDPLDSVKAEINTHVGVSIWNWVVLFSKSGLRIREELIVAVKDLRRNNTVSGGNGGREQTKLVVADLVEGTWMVEYNGVLEPHVVTNEGGILYLTAINEVVRLIPPTD
jgi:hypothetical protein